jgi:hypothetical protein
VILNSNPLEDIAHASDIQSVVKNGVAYSLGSLVSNDSLGRAAASTLPKTMKAVVVHEYGGLASLHYEGYSGAATEGE